MFALLMSSLVSPVWLGPAQAQRADLRADGLPSKRLAPMPMPNSPHVAQALDQYAELALLCVEREYPNKIAHVLSSDADIGSPSKLTPVFFGCFDWHSAVHGHWLLVRLLRTTTPRPWHNKARQILRRHVTKERVLQEAAYLRGPSRSSFERPYGLGWLLQLAAELAEWQRDGDDDAQRLLQALQPLVGVAIERLTGWLPKLGQPVRSGEHSQTAFAMGLALDYARPPLPVRIPLAAPKPDPGMEALATLIQQRALAFYHKDRQCPLSYEPSGEDFLSPCLAEADLMRRVLPAAEFTRWLTTFLPISTLHTLTPANPSDRTDGKLVHLDGLNLSRAWMLEGIAGALLDGPLRTEIQRLAVSHREAGLAALTNQSYEGGHWLGSFAAYLVTRRGIASTGGGTAR